MLQRALELRAEGKFKESYACLRTAAEEEGDPEAMYRICADWNFPSEKQKFGIEAAKKGYYLALVAFPSTVPEPKTSFELAHKKTMTLMQYSDTYAFWKVPLEPFVLAEHDLAQTFWLSNGGYFEPKLALGHKNPYVCGKLGEIEFNMKQYDDAQVLLQIAYDQAYYKHSEFLYNIYKHKKAFVKAFEIVSEANFLYTIYNIICEKQTLLSMQYVIGKWRATKNISLLYAISERKDKKEKEKFWNNLLACTSIYCDTKERAQNATFCWILCATKYLPLCKDVILIIAQKVWNFRTDPENWLIKK